MDTNDLSDLPTKALSELGEHLAKIQKIITELLSPPHFYVGRYGHMAGHAIHFHMIPVYDWVARTFDNDERYRVLRQFYTPGVYEDGSDSTFDGAEMNFAKAEILLKSTAPRFRRLSKRFEKESANQTLHSTEWAGAHSASELYVVQKDKADIPIQRLALNSYVN